MATTINTYSVGLTLDASDYIAKSSLTRTETARLRSAIEAARDPAERYTLAETRLARALREGAIDIQTHNRLLEDARRKHEAAAAATMRDTAAQNAGFGELAGRLRGLAAAYLGVSTVTKSIKLAIDAEQAEAQFEIFGGSVNNAKKLLGELREYANVSPLSLSGVRNAAIQMMQFGIPIQDVTERLKQLGAIAGGNEERFGRLTYAFSQMTSAGRLMGGDLKQMVEAGFNPLATISLKTGESLIELKKRMEDGGISSQEVADAFTSATAAGGKFDGMTERLAETMGGKLAIAMADLEQAGVNAGNAMAPLVIALTDGMETGKSVLDGVVVMIEKMVDGFTLILTLNKEIYGMITGNQYGTGALNKFLDDVEQRERERAEASQKREWDKTEVAKNEAAERRKIEQAAAEEEKKRIKVVEAAEKEADESRKRGRKNDEEMNEAIADARERAEKRMQDNWLRTQDERVKAARTRLQDVGKLWEHVSKGPGAGIEAASAEAARFLADMTNARLAAEAMPDQHLEEQALDEAEKQLEELKQQTTIGIEQKRIMERMVVAIEANGFSRIR